MSELIQPKVCAVCGQVCDRYQGEWVHNHEVIGMGTHVCIPVDYDMVQVVTRCDFCHRVVELKDRWIVVADDFKVPLVQSWSLGGWACESECAEIASRHDWGAMIDRHLASPESSTKDEPIYRNWLFQLYQTLSANMHEVRPFRAGDEMVAAKRPE